MNENDKVIFLTKKTLSVKTTETKSRLGSELKTESDRL